MRTHIVFDDTFELREQAITAFAGYSAPSGWSYRATVGAIVDGSLEGGQPSANHDMSPGFVVGLGVARQWKLGDGPWFVSGSAGLSVAAASTHQAGQAGQAGTTEHPRFVAGDARVGAIFGRTFAKIWSPYVLGRGFGGPVWWTVDGVSTVGTDTRHFQLGAGLSVAMSFGLTIVVDVSALGEQAASVGASWRL